MEVGVKVRPGRLDTDALTSFRNLSLRSKVVDEYTYFDGKVHSLVTNLTVERHWVLSGTPPIHDFAALKKIAAFLNIHLGVDDDGESQSAEVKRRRREQTGMVFDVYSSHCASLLIIRGGEIPLLPRGPQS